MTIRWKGVYFFSKDKVSHFAFDKTFLEDEKSAFLWGKNVKDWKMSKSADGAGKSRPRRFSRRWRGFAVFSSLSPGTHVALLYEWVLSGYEESRHRRWRYYRPLLLLLLRNAVIAAAITKSNEYSIEGFFYQPLNQSRMNEDRSAVD